MQKGLVIAAVFVLFVLPGVAEAQFFGPIVPQCEGSGSGVGACQACHFVQLGQNILLFLVSIGAFLAAIVFAVGGIKLVTARGNESQVSEAKRLFENAIIGFVIVLAAWLIIDTVLKVMLPTEGSGENAIGIVGNLGPWNKVQCVAQPKFVDTVGGGVVVRDTTGTGAPTGDGTCSTIDSGPCSTSNLSSAFGSETLGNQASQICNGESAGAVTSLSTADTLNSTGESFSVGLFQINLTVHELQGCGTGGSTLNCSDAFNGKNSSATIVDQNLYNDCVSAAQNAECNINNAVRIRNEREAREPSNPWADWSVAKLCGLAT